MFNSSYRRRQRRKKNNTGVVQWSFLRIIDQLQGRQQLKALPYVMILFHIAVNTATNSIVFFTVIYTENTWIEQCRTTNKLKFSGSYDARFALKNGGSKFSEKSCSHLIFMDVH